MLEIISFVIIIIILTISLFNRKNNIFPILGQQFKIYKNAFNGKIYWKDILVFVVVPIVVPLLLVFINKIYISFSIIEYLITAISIIFGLFLSFIALLIPSIENQDNLQFKQSMKETFITALFCMIISMIILIYSLICLSIGENNIDIISFSFFSYILYIELFYCILLLLKRIYNIYF